MSKKIWKRKSFWFAMLFALLTVFMLLLLVQAAQADIPALQPLLGWLGLALVVSFVTCVVAVWVAVGPGKH